MFGASDSQAFQSSSGMGGTFVVRIDSSDGSDVMRGQVQHVRSRQRTDFATRERLLSFIEAHLQEKTRCDAEADR